MLEKDVSRRSFMAGSAAVAGAAALATTGCSKNEDAGSAPVDDGKATLVFKNAHVQTMVSEDDVAEAVAVAGNEIVYVGDTAGVEEFIGDDTEVIDLDGAFLAPGFIDSHIHAPGSWNNKLFAICLDGMTTNEEYLAEVKRVVEANPDNEAYWGGTFMFNAYELPDGSNPGPLASDLDAICADKPILINDVSHHCLWVNSKALELGGITKDTPDPAGGLIYRDADGNPTGCLADNAMNSVNAAVSTAFTEEQTEEALYKFMEEANSYGVTGMCNMGDGGGFEANKLYHKLDEKGDLTVRFMNSTTTSPGMDPDDILKQIQDSKEFESDMVHTQLAKIFYDGVTESGTAYMLEPYLESTGLGSDWYGEPVWPQEDFAAMVKKYDAAGLQVHVHAIGDGAVRNTIDSYLAALAENGDRDHRHTITHVCAITDEDIQRMADNDIIASLQFLWMYGDPLYELECSYIGKERADAMYPVKKMWDTGVMISGASDNPVTPFVVTDEIEIGVTRNSPFPGEEDTDMTRWPEQGLTAYQMLEAYTKHSAYQNFWEDLVGTIEVGKKADIVVLDQNILDVDPVKINDSKVLYTVSDGRIVYKG
ncbi:amidohydrolase [Collinsella provencensis]|uniref:amidohydrolase n=1 Tax=Collinsella provencensis TaxID=1937461 RepID=UPI000C81BFAC|nr:amidohydrolase [Collinsella provencensis]